MKTLQFFLLNLVLCSMTTVMIILAIDSLLIGNYAVTILATITFICGLLNSWILLNKELNHAKLKGKYNE